MLRGFAENTRAATGFWRGYIIFAGVSFFGLVLGAWFLDLIGIRSESWGEQVVYFMVPILLVWYIWVKWGRAQAET
jgi:hypothetical protein